MSEDLSPLSSNDNTTISDNELRNSAPPVDKTNKNMFCDKGPSPSTLHTPVLPPVDSPIVPPPACTTLSNLGTYDRNELPVEKELVEQKGDGEVKIDSKTTKKRRRGRPLHTKSDTPSSSNTVNNNSEAVHIVEAHHSTKKIKIIDGHQPKPYEDNKRSRNDSMREHNIQVAASGLFGYIALECGLLERYSMEDLVDETIFSLAEFHRPGEAVSYLTAPTSQASGTKKMMPAIQVRFRSEDDLKSALGPITIFGYETQIERYRGGKSCVFKIRLGTWAGEEEKVRRAFEVQAMVEVQAWGWRELCKMKTHVVMLTTLPPGKVVSGIQVDGWWLEMQREEEGICCCCGNNHSCFDSGVKCTQFKQA